MAVFDSSEKLYNCFCGLFELMERHPQTQAFLKGMELTVTFAHTKPEASITLITRGGEQSIHCGECNASPDIQLAMTGDIAHNFWMGKINVMRAITTQQIALVGSLSKILALKPLIKAAIELYPQHFQDFLSRGSC